jgi:Raf kinase inhibitor-like YbhB/YbcL family protein
MSLAISSPAFSPGASIPPKYTCEGGDVAPELRFSGIPQQAKSLALIVEDPDAPDPAAPQRTFVHWVVYDIPPDAGAIPESPHGKSLPRGAHAGANDWKRAEYGGACPPTGRHRYFFKLYALDTKLGDLGDAPKPKVLDAMKGHVLEEAQLMGTYEKRQ